MYNVLVPIDRDEDRALAQADAVRRLPDAGESVTARLLHVSEDGGADPDDFAERGVGERVVEELTGAGVTVDVEVRTGDPATEILAVADESAADVIVLGGRKRPPLGTLLFGSVSQSVMLEADRPVAVTGTAVKRDPSHRCRGCGEIYYTDPNANIAACRNCGGVHVESYEAEPDEPAASP